ncbi:hypothetical protein A9Q96_08400 [Rhodobacterales bacterium 52_120_T64]|nr:hypothetical protein A9Q96_08400 [Rhodobacterales bacterium 52_120_T64]
MNKRTKLPVAAEYEVGYGKPPKSRQFEKGRSGNPNGRPKGARNKPAKRLTKIRDMLLAEAEREVIIQEKEGPVSLPIAQAAMRSLIHKAVKGNVEAQKFILSSIAAAESDNERELLETLQTVADYKDGAYAEIARRKRNGVETCDDILPHPDHIEVDVRTGDVIFMGPVDERDKKDWDDLWARKAGFEEEIEYIRALLAAPETSEDINQFVQDDLKSTNNTLQLIEQAIIMRWNRPVREVVKDRSRWKETKLRIENGVWPERASG